MKKRTPIDDAIFQSGMKKGYIAKEAGINPGTLSLIISGKSEPTLRVALKLSRIVGKTVEELWGYLDDGQKD